MKNAEEFVLFTAGRTEALTEGCVSALWSESY